MFSDTHFHFHHIVCERGENGAEILSKMAQNKVRFGLDIGTRCDDLESRYQVIENALSQMENETEQKNARNFLYYSAGIWPDVTAIEDRTNQLKTLEGITTKAMAKPQKGETGPRIVALGEFGLDHHWDPAGVDKRSENQFNPSIYQGERELFEAQLDMARRLDLPCLIHSRDAFEDTLDCIKNVGYHRGIIHCYSYGPREAEKFLELGWYISFAGGVTYTKKARMDEMHELLNLVPENKILCETDAPYLAPVPLRGQSNNPTFVEHTYRFVAEHRGISAEELSETVDENISRLFRLPDLMK